MRAVVQRVRSARVSVRDEAPASAAESGGAGPRCVAEMGVGLLALVGVARGDDAAAARELARKLVHLRVFPDADGRMNRTLADIGGALGVVSQFTLLGDVRKGRRPSYASAAPPEQAEPLVEAVIETARGLGVHVVSGRFRASMEVALVNDGPVTILVDTEKRF